MSKDTSIVAQFKVINDTKSAFLFPGAKGDTMILAWTTTPWTLPSNTALVVGAHIRYVQVNTYNPYTFKPVSVVLARVLMEKYFPAKNKESLRWLPINQDKQIPFEGGAGV